MTFRQTHDGTLLQAYGQWDDGNGAIAPKEDPLSQTSSGRTPLTGQGAKKKISLADYKRLDKTKPRASDVNATAIKGPTETKVQDMNGAMKKEDMKKDEAGLIAKAAPDTGQVIEHALKRYVLHASYPYNYEECH